MQLQLDARTGNNPQPVVNGNSIYSNTGYNYYAQSYFNAASVVLDASGNWWGSTDLSTIASKIYDYTNSPTNSPVVQFTPILDSAGGVPVVGNYLNGPLTADQTLVAGTVYDVVGRIDIPTGITLTIPAGVTLRFINNNRLIVDGTLLIQGALGNEVILTSTNATPARGNWRN